MALCIEEGGPAVEDARGGDDGQLEVFTRASSLGVRSHELYLKRASWSRCFPLNIAVVCIFILSLYESFKTHASYAESWRLCSVMLLA